MPAAAGTAGGASNRYLIHRIFQNARLANPLATYQLIVIASGTLLFLLQYHWPHVEDHAGFRETKMHYVFEYLPAGLFNRVQVRLYQFSDSSVIWKKGSKLVKNGHHALMTIIG